MLRRHVGTDARLGNHSGNRSVIDDGAAAGAEHVLNLILHREEHAFQVDGDNLIERRFFNVSEQSSRGKDAGVIEGTVQPAVGLHRGSDKALDLLRVAHICLDKERSASFSLNRLNGFPAFRVHIANDNLGAVPCEEKGRGAADTRAATGNDRYLIREVKGTVLSHDCVR